MNLSYLEIAERLGARICRDALWHEGRCNWTTDSLEGDTLAHGALGSQLYDGASGIALFLWRLAALTGERVFRATAEAALRQALSRIPAGCGLYSGGLGVLYAASEILGEVDAHRVQRQAGLDSARLDVIDGSAGAIPVLLHLHARAGQAGLLAAALKHGDHLLAAAQQNEDGWSWKTTDADRNLTGFSHGAAGIAWGLLELFRVTGGSRFRDAALEAFRYERSCFSPAEQNWPDFRADDAEYPVYWCHGAAGIGFSRLRAWKILGDGTSLAEARTALATVCDRSKAAGNFSLCHGQAGNADLLIYAGELLGEHRWRQEAERIAEEGYQRYEQRRVPWPCGLAGANETPDLMLGLAGIGYFYLRLADPIRVPSVLLPGCC